MPLSSPTLPNSTGYLKRKKSNVWATTGAQRETLKRRERNSIWWKALRPTGRSPSPKSELICLPLGQQCPTYINFISRQNAENGDPKVLKSGWPGNSGKFRVCGEFPQKTPIRGIPGNSFWGPHFGDLGGIFWGKWERPKLICWAGVPLRQQIITKFLLQFSKDNHVTLTATGRTFSGITPEKRSFFRQPQEFQSSYPAEVRMWNFSPFFSAKGVVKFGVKFWWNLPRYVFQGLGVRRKISPKFHVKNGVENGKFHANFTLLRPSAEELCLKNITFCKSSSVGSGWVSYFKCEICSRNQSAKIG